jgi:hypothetical protein
MRFTRRALLAAIPLLLAAPAAGAQSPFEGVITMRMRSERAPEPMTIRYLVREGRFRSEMSMAGMEMAAIVDPVKREVYSVMPAQRMYMVMPLPDDAAAGGRTPEVTKTGRRETIAGHACEHFLVKTEQQTMDVCLATDLPAMMMGGGMGRGGRGASADAWVRALGRQPGFPLKVTVQGANEAMLEVTGIEPKKLDAALFSPPSDFQRMQMPGRP